jgi:hypothetical protein
MPIAKKYRPSQRTTELIIYISDKLKNKSNYGSTLLSKALCFIDAMSYLKTGKPISNLTYIKQEFGPTPEPSKYLSIRDHLTKTEELEKVETFYFGKKQTKFIAAREANIRVFDTDEIVLIDDVLESICELNAATISDFTHQFISWIFANHKEELPFYTFLLSKTEPEKKDYTWANQAIKAYYKSTRKAS